MIYLDTNTLVRFFTNDTPEQAEIVEKLLEEKFLCVPDVVFPELEYVLTKSYKSSRTEVITVYRFLLAKKNIRISSVMEKAVVFFEATNLDMADCIIASYALKGRLASFDRQLLKIPGIKKYWNS